jgi:hypothetical protein
MNSGEYFTKNVSIRSLVLRVFREYRERRKGNGTAKEKDMLGAGSIWSRQLGAA